MQSIRITAHASANALPDVFCGQTRIYPIPASCPGYEGIQHPPNHQSLFYVEGIEYITNDPNLNNTGVTYVPSIEPHVARDLPHAGADEPDVEQDEPLAGVSSSLETTTGGHTDCLNECHGIDRDLAIEAIEWFCSLNTGVKLYKFDNASIVSVSDNL